MCQALPRLHGSLRDMRAPLRRGLRACRRRRLPRLRRDLRGLRRRVRGPRGRPLPPMRRDLPRLRRGVPRNGRPRPARGGRDRARGAGSAASRTARRGRRCGPALGAGLRALPSGAAAEGGTAGRCRDRGAPVANPPMSARRWSSAFVRPRGLFRACGRGWRPRASMTCSSRSAWRDGSGASPVGKAAPDQGGSGGALARHLRAGSRRCARRGPPRPRARWRRASRRASGRGTWPCAG